MILRELKKEDLLALRKLWSICYQRSRMLLGFLYRFDAEMHALELRLPDDIPLPALIDTPYEVECRVENPYMLRALNTEAILRALNRGDFGRFVIEVADDCLIKKSQGNSISKWTACERILRGRAAGQKRF